MKDRHFLLIIIAVAFFGAMFWVTGLASSLALDHSRASQNIPAELVDELDLIDTSQATAHLETDAEALDVPAQQTELERLDTLLRVLADNEPESRILIGSSHLQ